MTDTRRWLKEPELELHDSLVEILNSHDEYIRGDGERQLIVSSLESLAECKRLLKKHEWVKKNGLGFCLECHKFRYENHAVDCALARQTGGLPVEIENKEVK